MPQTQQIVETLKGLLKKEGKTYSDVADHLQLSQASVKRLFADSNLSIQRLDDICMLLDIEISDVILEMCANQHTISELTQQQEKSIAGNLDLLMITVLVLNHWSLKEIIERYNFTEVQCIRYFAHLDRLGIIELLPNNRFKLLTARNFSWRENGPIMQVFRQKIDKEYFSANFGRKTEKLIVLNGMLSESSNNIFQRKMDQLAADFDCQNNNDERLDLDIRRGSTVIISIRDWDYESLFSENRRK